jgi:hypothetical protein
MKLYTASSIIFVTTFTSVHAFTTSLNQIQFGRVKNVVPGMSQLMAFISDISCYHLQMIEQCRSLNLYNQPFANLLENDTIFYLG